MSVSPVASAVSLAATLVTALALAFIFNNTNIVFTVFVKSKSMTVKQLRFAIRKQLRPVVAALVA